MKELLSISVCRLPGNRAAFLWVVDTRNAGPAVLANRHNNRRSLRKFPASSPLELLHGSMSSALNNPDTVCIAMVHFVAGEGNWMLPSTGTGAAKCKDCSQVVWECLPACPEAGRRWQGVISRTQLGSLLTVHLINEDLADTPWIINEVIQLWLFPSLVERLFTQMPLIRLYSTSQLGLFYVQLYGDNSSVSFRSKSDVMNFVIY